MIFRFFIHYIILCVFITSCISQKDYYSLNDFRKVKKIDVHTHIYNTTDPSLVEQAITDGFKLICMNVEVPYLPAVDSQKYFVLKQRSNFPDYISWVTSFSTDHINEEGWAQQQLDYLKNCVDSGAVGVKVWKNIGMTIKGRDSNFIMIDHPVFDPIFNYMEQHNILLIGHLGEPKNCWLPLDQMTTINDSLYFSEYPQYHMYLHPRYPSYEEQITATRQLLNKHPKLRFVGAHLASLEWDVDKIAEFLDTYPKAMVEIAARVGQLQYQSNKDWHKVRNFFIKYSNRIMYGTDLEAEKSLSADETKKRAYEMWLRDWKYFTTNATMSSPFIHEKIQGLALPKKVINKFYYTNAAARYFNNE